MGAGHGHGHSQDGRKIERKISQEIEKSLEEEHSHAKSIQVLILGLENSGKKTLMKQIRLLYGSGLDPEEIKNYVSIVRRNVVESIQVLVHNLEHSYSDLSAVVSSPPLLKQISSLDISDLKADLLQDQKAFETAAKTISILWQDTLFQRTLLQNPGKFPSLASSQYFLNQLNHIIPASYVPSDNDILRCREPTLGLLEATVQIQESSFRFLCMRGSKGQRRKWLPSFGAGEESIAAVMFVASLDEYDQTHPNPNRDSLKEEILSAFPDWSPSVIHTVVDFLEEENVSKLRDSIDFFEEICGNKFYEHVGLVLLLNRRNIFNEKLKTVPLNRHFHDYRDGDSPDSAARYIEHLFKEKNKYSTRKIYSFSTDAIDKGNVAQIMKEVLQLFTSNSIK